VATSEIMDDSGLFMQWALSTLQEQQEPPPVPAADDSGSEVTIVSLLDQFGHPASPDCTVPGRPPVLEARRWAATSWSAGDTNSGSDGGGNAPVPVPAMERDGLSPSLDSVKRATAATQTGSVGSGTSQPMSWDFSHSASPRLSNEVMPINYAAAARSSAPYARDHTISERKRREKISQRLIELSTVIPGLTKTDKATILGDAVRYVKELQEKLRVLEDGSRKNGRSFSPVLAKKPRIATPNDEDAVLPSYPPAASNAEIDARISGDNVTVRIHCKDAKGVLVKLLTEVEGLHLSIIDTNVMPFLECTLIINIMAKVEEGFNSKPDDIVGSLKSVLHQHGTRNSTQEKRSSC
uniref:BHLH domain-containing protein n=2 Tax=Setaria italica TaxID=4555 RepID=K3YBW5_SETIT